MKKTLKEYKGDDLRKIVNFAQSEIERIFYPQKFYHLYIQLDMEDSLERATKIDEAKEYLKITGRAAAIVDDIIGQTDGLLLEFQGTMLHVAYRKASVTEKEVLQNIGTIHRSLKGLKARHDQLYGWRMAMDSGMTLLVSGTLISGETSLVSLAKSANRPAKFIYAQKHSIENEEDRDLKREHLAMFREDDTRTTITDLNELPWLRELEEEVNFSNKDYKVEVRGLHRPIQKQVEQTFARAEPVPFSDATSGEHFAYFGWVMRADLDGFTQTVADCHDQPEQLAELALQFSQIMDHAENFSHQHNLSMVQLPWAGDNYTTAVTFHNIEDYNKARKENLIEFSLDFEEYMETVTNVSDFKGWAQGIAGGDSDSRHAGTVFISSVKTPNRSFIIGAGIGMGRSVQAFTDMNPNVDEFAVFNEDRNHLLKPYKEVIQDDNKVNNEKSTLFKKGLKDEFIKARKEISDDINFIKPVPSLVSVGTSTVSITPRSYAE